MMSCDVAMLYAKKKFQNSISQKMCIGFPVDSNIYSEALLQYAASDKCSLESDFGCFSEFMSTIRCDFSPIS